MIADHAPLSGYQILARQNLMDRIRRTEDWQSFALTSETLIFIDVFGSRTRDFG